MKTHSQYEDIKGVLRTLSNIEDGGFAKIANVDHCRKHSMLDV